MRARVRRQPWIAAALLARINRFHAAPPAVRVASLLLPTVVVALMLWALVAAVHHRFGMPPASLRWPPATGLGAWTAVCLRKRIRDGMAEHHRGWMQAWPLAPRRLMLQLGLLASLPVLVIAVWVAILGGELMASGATSQIGWNLAGVGVGMFVGLGFGCWPATGYEVITELAPVLPLRVGRQETFTGLTQLREWQRCAIARLSLRRWVLWMAPILLMAPSGMGGKAIAQILLLVLFWPLYARGMAASLDTISAASALLAATPLATRALCRPLLRRPIGLASSLALAVALDLAWLGSSALLIGASCAVILLFETGRMALRCWLASQAFTACIPRPKFASKGKPR